MSEIDEMLWSAGDGSRVSHDDWRRIYDYVAGRLVDFFGVPLQFGEPKIGRGFSNGFQTVGSFGGPFDLLFWGNFGTAIFDAGTPPAVEGVVYFYSDGLRLVALRGENNIEIRYAKADVGFRDYEMRGCTGPGAWIFEGWDHDEFGEFEGYETWPFDT